MILSSCKKNQQLSEIDINNDITIDALNKSEMDYISESESEPTGKILNSEKKFFILGVENYKKKKYDRAYNYFKQAIVNSSKEESLKIKFNIIKCLEKKNEFDKALKLVNELILENPGNQKFLKELSYLYYKTGNTGSALEIYDKLKEDFSISMNKAVYLAKMNDIKSARAILEQLLNNKNINDELKIKIYINLTIIYISQNMTDEASKIMDRASELFPDSAEINYYYGFLLYNLSKKIDSIIYFKKAISLSADYAAAYKMLGIIYSELGNMKITAFKTLTAAYKLDNRDPQTLIYLCNILYDEGNYKSAYSLLRQAYNLIENQNIKSKIFYRMCYCLEKMKRFNEAITLLNNYLKDNQPDISITFLLGRIYQKNNDFTNALYYYDKLINTMPVQESDRNIIASAYCNMGNIYFQKKIFDKAKEYYDKSLKINPSTEVIYNISKIPKE